MILVQLVKVRAKILEEIFSCPLYAAGRGLPQIKASNLYLVIWSAFLVFWGVYRIFCGVFGIMRCVSVCLKFSHVLCSLYAAGRRLPKIKASNLYLVILGCVFGSLGCIQHIFGSIWYYEMCLWDLFVLSFLMSSVQLGDAFPRSNTEICI